MKSYSVKEIFLTLQGEGANAGRAAVFLRFSGCNLWDGREESRRKARCSFCDTDFRGLDGPLGGRYADAQSLAAAVLSLWRDPQAPAFVVMTGGEPALQLDAVLIAALHARGAHIAVETNGTIALPPGPDWVCVSPKAGCALAQKRGDELKLVFPQSGLDPAAFAGLDFRHFFLQPMDGEALEENTRQSVAYCLEHPRWRLSLQTHKYIGIA